MKHAPPHNGRRACAALRHGPVPGLQEVRWQRWPGPQAAAARGWRQHAALAARQGPRGGWERAASRPNPLAARRRSGSALPQAPRRPATPAAARGGSGCGGAFGEQAGQLFSQLEGCRLRPEWCLCPSRLERRPAGSLQPARRHGRSFRTLGWVAAGRNSWLVPRCHYWLALHGRLLTPAAAAALR